MSITTREGMVVHQALKKMWKQDYFDICTIKSCCEVLNLKPKKELYDMLHAMHCVHYSDMDTAVLKELQVMVKELFDLDRVLDYKAGAEETRVISDNFKDLVRIGK